MKKSLTAFILGAALTLGAVLAASSFGVHLPFLGHDEDSSHGHGDAKGPHAHEGEAPGAHAGHAEEGPVKLTEKEMKEFGVEIGTAGPGKLILTLPLTGEVRLNGDQLAHVVPRVTGVAREVRSHLGDDVKSGDIMAVVDSRELADAKGAYLAARERYDLAKATYDREEDLFKKKVSSGQALLEAKQGLAEALINVRSSDQKLHALGYSHEEIEKLPELDTETITHYEVTAPIDGTVIEKHITHGEALKDDADAYLVADLSTVWIDLSIYQKDLVRIAKGQRIRISSGPAGTEAQGTISYVGPVIGEKTRTALARVVLPNPDGKWKPGLFVTAEALVEEAEVGVLVPKTALQILEQEPHVFVRTEKGFEAREIKIGRSNRTHLEITSGLTPGTPYVVRGAFAIKSELQKGSFGHGHSH